MKVIGLICSSYRDQKMVIQEVEKYCKEHSLSLKSFPRSCIPGWRKWTQEVTIFRKIDTDNAASLTVQAWPEAKLIYVSPRLSTKTDPDFDRLRRKSHWVVNPHLPEDVFRKSVRDALETFFKKAVHRPNGH